ncbi:MAG: hypothetical protein WHX52_22230 [Anaerolineae bacterium]|mgnify:CR=1 FL=1
MVSDALGKQLHNRVTRGETLSEEEQAQLEAWYDKQDREETLMLQRDAPAENQDSLQADIDRILYRIGNTARQIQNISQQNEVLREEIMRFRRQLAQQATVQFAWQ